MNATETENQTRATRVEAEARIVMDLLREYAGKVAELNRHLSHLVTHGINAAQVNHLAWLLDQSELIRKPLLNILSRGSGLGEHSALEPITEDELALRMTETEIHLHHMIRMAGDLRSIVDKSQKSEQVARLRVAAGLNGMKGGPLRPN